MPLSTSPVLKLQGHGTRPDFLHGCWGSKCLCRKLCTHSAISLSLAFLFFLTWMFFICTVLKLVVVIYVWMFVCMYICVSISICTSIYSYSMRITSRIIIIFHTSVLCIIKQTSIKLMESKILWLIDFLVLKISFLIIREWFVVFLAVFIQREDWDHPHSFICYNLFFFKKFSSFW